MKKINKIVFIATPISLIVLIGLLIYWHSTRWLFTQSYNQRNVATNYLTNIYAGNFKNSYMLISPILQSQLPYDNFVATNLAIRNKYNTTTFQSYKIEGKFDLITGTIKDKSHGINYTFSIVLNNSSNKITYLLVTPSS